MKDYIQKLLPRLQQYSYSLDRKEIFIDFPWVRLDEKGNKETYIFKRNGQLVMSINGVAEIGSWELLATSGMLLIDRIKDKMLLRHDFIDKAILALKTDDLKSKPFILINSNIIKDLNVEAYLEAQYPKGGNINQPTPGSDTDRELTNYDIWEMIIITVISLAIMVLAAYFYNG